MVILFWQIFEKVCIQKGGLWLLFLLYKVKNDIHFYFFKVKYSIHFRFSKVKNV